MTRSKETVTSRGSDPNTSPTWSHPRGLGRFKQMQWKLRVVLNSGMRRFKNLIQERHENSFVKNGGMWIVAKQAGLLPYSGSFFEWVRF